MRQMVCAEFDIEKTRQEEFNYSMIASFYNFL